MSDQPFTYTKDELIKKLKELAAMGWVENGRFGNHGGIGNTLEDFLGIAENNLPILNAAEWELKAQRLNSTSLTTLFHIEPSLRAVRSVPQVLLPKYGWRHQEAGKKYGDDEMIFRQTIHGNARSDRGFKVVIDRTERKILISFDAKSVDIRHEKWLEIEPQPYWGFDDAGTKLLNAFYVQAEVKRENDKEYYRYSKVTMLQKFSFEGFLNALEKGLILVDFDACFGHNHGTKFRMRQNALPMLYEKTTTIS
jgi:hypothetical protein